MGSNYFRILQTCFNRTSSSNVRYYENVLTDQAVLSNNAGDSGAYVSEERVRKIVKEILRIYDADKTGQVDYALESAGNVITPISDRTAADR